MTQTERYHHRDGTTDSGHDLVSGRVTRREPRMAKSAQASQWTGYASTVTMLVLALLFPVGLMIFNPTLMFERGWEQYVGTGIYFWAVVTLCRELRRLWRNEQAFEDSPA